MIRVVVLRGRGGSRIGPAQVIRIRVVVIITTMIMAVMAVPIIGVMSVIAMMVVTVVVSIVIMIRNTMIVAVMLMRMSMFAVGELAGSGRRSVAIADKAARITGIAKRKVQSLPAHDLGDIDEQDGDC